MREQKVKEILTFFKRASDLKVTPRYGATLKHDNDSVAEHSWQLALMVFIIGIECEVNVNLNHAMGMALLHDLAEAKTGDIDAYKQIIEGQSLIDEKSTKEASAMHDLTDDLSFGDWIYNFWKEYEDQETIEAKFVRALDKIEAFMHISERGVKAYIPKEFHADYADKAVEAFDEAARHFPEVKDLLSMIKQDLKTQFEEVGVKWITKDMVAA